MTPTDGRRFAELMMALGETFREPVSDFRAEIYFNALKNLPLAEVETAVQLAIQGKTFFPKPAELRELVNGNASSEADLAWAAFQREVTRVGYMRTPSLPETTMATVRQVFGSWRAACSALPSPDSDRAPELMGWRKQFVAAYSDTKRREAAGYLTDGEAKGALADISAWRAKQIQGETA